MKIEWSEWVKVSNWLDKGKNAGPEIPDAFGVYMLRVPGTILYVGSTYSSNKVKKGPDNFTGLRKRIGLFISCAMGFGAGHSAGRQFFDLFIKDDPAPEFLDHSGRDLRPTARDVEVRWSVVDCPPCAEREAYHQTTPQPLFNRETPKQCGREGCPYVKAWLDLAMAVRATAPPVARIDLRSRDA
jgi:hypothetical protein